MKPVLHRHSLSGLLGTCNGIICRSVSPSPSPHHTNRIWISTYSYLTTHTHETKPPIPYQPGVILSAQTYTPPPTPSYYNTWAYGKLRQDIAEQHSLQLCLQYPPAAGVPGRETFQLQIQRPIRVEDLARSQIVRAQVLNREPDLALPGLPAFTATAGVAVKLYDPLYYDFDDFNPNPFANCDAAFARETRTYLQLQPVYDYLTPRFYGSCSVDVPIPDKPSQMRPVRAILYDYVSGTSLASSEITDYTMPQRKAIMSAIMDHHSILWQMDVEHNDLHPRNVLVISAKEGEKADVRFIDFERAMCGTRAREGHIATTEPEPRTEIIKRWLDEDANDYAVDFLWFIDWPWNEWLRNEYTAYQV